MSATVAPPAIHKWVDGLSPVQVERLRTMAEQDDVLPAIEPDNSPVETWLRTTVAAAYDRFIAGEEKAISGDEVQAMLEARRAERAKAA